MTTQEMLEERYGIRPFRSRRRAWIIVGVAALLAAAALAWATWSNAAASATAHVTAFEVIDSSRVSVTFQVSAPVGSAVACAVEAQDADHGVVGWRVVEYAASETDVEAYTEVLPTVAAATTGLVNSCWVI